MRLWHIPLRNLRLRALSSTLTSASIALGTMLVAFLWIVAAEAERKYHSSARGFKSIVGPPGTSALEIVLCTVFNLRVPQGSVPLSVYKDLHDGRLPNARPGMIRHAIPIALGDNYRNFRIVATTDEWFNRFSRGQDAGGKPQRLEFAEGRGFKFTHEELLRLADDLAEDARKRKAGEADHDHHDDEIPAAWKEVVLGSEVARKLGLQIGAKVVPAHELQGDSHTHDEGACTVVGILAPTHTPIDKALYLPLGVHLRLQGHDAISKLEQQVHADAVRLSAIIIDTRDHIGDQLLRVYFQSTTVAQAASTQQEINNLFKLTGNITAALYGLAGVVMVVAGIGILVALYNTMNDRKREIAIMRSLGAQRFQILVIVLFEATAIATVGGVLGVLGAHAATVAFGGLVESQIEVPVSDAPFSLNELWLVLGVIGLGAISGILPAIKASLTGVAENLSPTT